MNFKLNFNFNSDACDESRRSAAWLGLGGCLQLTRDRSPNLSARALGTLFTSLIAGLTLFIVSLISRFFLNDMAAFFY